MLSNPIWDMLFGEVEVKSTIKQRKLVKTVTSLPGWCSELCIQVRGYDRKIGQLENVTSFFFFWPRFLVPHKHTPPVSISKLHPISDPGEC